MSPELRGACAFAIMAALFHLLQENKPLSIFSFLPSWFHLENINAWIAARFHTSRERIVQFELGGLFALGFTLMQIGEWAASVGCWVLLACIFFAKAIAWEGIGGQKGLTALLRFSAAFGAITMCVLLVTITDLRKPENEPWSNLQKLWPQKSALGLRYDTPEMGQAWLHIEQEPQNLSLRDLFLTDMGATASDFHQDNWLDPRIDYIREMNMQDRTMFLKYYIPASTKTYQACEWILANYHHHLTDTLLSGPTALGDNTVENSKRLFFTKVIYVYHESELPPGDVDLLGKQFRQEGDITLHFRGHNYWLEQRNLLMTKHLNKSGSR